MNRDGVVSPTRPSERVGAGGSKGRGSARRLTAWSLALLSLSVASAAHSSDLARALDPYRELARTDGGGRLLAMARATMERAFTNAAGPDSAASAPDWPGPPAGVFVSLVDGPATRACVGSAVPLGGTLAETLRGLATRALSSDPRHAPVRHEELGRLRIVIAFAGPSEPVSDPMHVNPSRDGLLITTSRGSVAFLPGEARTISWALREARRIGVLQGSRSDAAYQRFPVVALREPPPPRPERPDAPE